MAAREGAVNAHRAGLCQLRDLLITTPEPLQRELARAIETLTRRLAPQLLDQPGVGPLAAAQLLISWSHRGRIRSEAAFARLAGCAPIPASSGQTIRYRLDRSGDRRLNRALHLILVTRRRAHPATIAYINRRVHEGKSRREATRCIKRYLGRSLYRLLEHPPMTT
jgi:transposase